MSDKLKEFVNENRQGFDSKEPSANLWNKIDAGMKLNTSAAPRSKWLFSHKFLGLSASVIVITLFFLGIVYVSDSKQEPGDVAPKGTSLASEQKITEEPRGNNEKTPLDIEMKSLNSGTLSSDPHHNKFAEPVILNKENQAGLNANASQDISRVEKMSSDSLNHFYTSEAVNTLPAEKKENALVRNNKKAKLYIPAEPEEPNTFTGTLYEGPSFRAMLRAYKFPGKFNIDEGGFKIISCSHLEKVPNIKAIWIKGKTDKELILSVKRKFKNVILVKKDGRELKPEAISHYYRGLGVMSEFRGRAFNMLFRDKVELILFFKDAEDGDKIIIGGVFKALVKSQP